MQVILNANTFEKNMAACDKNDSSACLQVGYLYRVGKTPDKKVDIRKSIQYLVKSCDMNNGVACRSLGYKYYYGRHVEKDTNKAKEYLDKACRANDLVSCAMYKEITE